MKNDFNVFLKKLIIMFVIGILIFIILTKFASAISYSTIQYNNQSLELNTYCQNYFDKSYCDSSTECFVTLYNNTGSKIINYQSLTYHSIGLFTYSNSTLNTTLINGEYRTAFVCNNTYGINTIDSFISLQSPPINVEYTTSGGGLSLISIDQRVSNISILMNTNINENSNEEIKVLIYNNKGNLIDIKNISFIIEPISSEVNIIGENFKRVNTGEYITNISISKIELNDFKERIFNFTVIADDSEKQHFSSQFFNVNELKVQDKFLNWVKNISDSVFKFFKSYFIYLLILMIFLIGILFYLMYRILNRKGK